MFINVKDEKKEIHKRFLCINNWSQFVKLALKQNARAVRIVMFY